MSTERQTKNALIIVIIAFVLQFLIAPWAHIDLGTPHFVVILVLPFIMLTSSVRRIALPFFAGLAFNLLFGGVVGSFSLVFTLVSVLIARIVDTLDNHAAITACIALALGTFLIEFFIGLIQNAVLHSSDFLQACIHIILPSWGINFVLSLVAYFILARIVSHRNAQNTPSSVINVR